MREKCGMLHLPLGDSVRSFDLEKAVCNHGLFMMAPNKWIPSSKTFQRPLRLADCTTSVTVSISHPPNQTSLLIQVHCSPTRLSPADQQAILDQVIRMLRITQTDEDNVTKFQNLLPKAKEMGFGRVFRSPTLFEDAVKSILLCNASWRRTLTMARQLCDLQAKIAQNYSKKRKRGQRKSRSSSCGDDHEGNFPNATELSKTSVTLLRKYLVGYRAAYIIKFAQGVENGRIDLEQFERTAAASGAICDIFTKIKGFGPFATANLLMCMGFYHQLPIDTETIRHLKQVHGRQLCNKKTVKEDVKEIYDKYAPFQCLAYWLELIEYYESKFGKLSQLGSHDYDKISGSTSASDTSILKNESI